MVRNELGESYGAMQASHYCDGSPLITALLPVRYWSPNRSRVSEEATNGDTILAGSIAKFV
jgi:hypothetical protein